MTVIAAGEMLPAGGSGRRCVAWPARGSQSGERYSREGTLYGHIVDWQLQPGAIGRGGELLASVWNQLGEWNVGRVSAWAHANEHLIGLFADRGLTPCGRTSNFCYYDFGAQAASAAEEHLSTGTCWRIVMADSDVY